MVKGEFYREKAIDQWTRDLPVKAVRGEIVDKNGVLLAGNTDTFSVFVRTRCVTDSKEVCSALSELLEVNYDDLYNKVVNKGVSEITVAKNVTAEKKRQIQARMLEGVYFSPDNQRVYPYGEMLCQTLGYVSSDASGQSGLEKYYDAYLKGTDGEILYESDLIGLDIQGKQPSYVAAQNGLSLRLTIDSEIQQICEAEMQKAVLTYSPVSAKVLVMQPKTGAILALAQRPSFDLNKVPRDDIDYLMKVGRNEFFTDSYEPGSTFKVITSAANLQEYFNGSAAAFPPSHIFSSGRYRIIGGRKIKCWSSHANGKHSSQNLALALNNSCNPIFVDIALSLGKKTLYEYINKFNFGKVTGVDFQGEALGMVIPERAVTDGDLARIGFGQTIAVTGLQLASAVSAAVSGGEYHRPYLVEEIYSESGSVFRNYPVQTNRVIGENASKLLASYLEGVVSSGSGKQAYIDGYKVGGKTGTAQKYENGVISSGKYVMSFIGFFPADNPKYLALVIVDEPIGGTYGSTVAAPICKNIFEKIIQAKNIQMP